MKVGSFFPEQAGTVFYAMGGDDCSLFFDLDKLTEKQAADHLTNIQLTAALQVALIALGKPGDHVALFEVFAEPRWARVLARYRRLFELAGFAIAPEGHVVFGRVSDFYDSLVGRVPPVDLVNLYMVSGSNAVLHRDPAALAVSRNLNSKFHFAANAPAFGIPVPATFVTTKAGLDEPATRAFVRPLLARDGSVMLKINGLAGARNVTTVESIEAARAYAEQNGDDTAVLLQKRLDVRDFTEMTADLRVTDTDISIANVRQILFANGLWIGNYIPASVDLPADQAAALLRVGEYARAHGGASPEGINCGVDYFVGPAGEVVVTEINVRWTGGLFPTQAIKQIRPEGEEAVVCFDVVASDDIDTYLDFVERSLSPGADAAYACIALGFSPFERDIGGRPHVFVWHLVLGDFEAFRRAKQAELPSGMLPTTDLIQLPA